MAHKVRLPKPQAVDPQRWLHSLAAQPEMASSLIKWLEHMMGVSQTQINESIQGNDLYGVKLAAGRMDAYRTVIRAVQSAQGNVPNG